MFTITPQLTIPDDEVTVSFSRSSGPGGQNVNKVETRVTLEFDVRNSTSLSEEQQSRVLDHLVNRINKDGVLQIHCDTHRSQQANRKEAEDRFVALMAQALKPVRKRRPTRVPRSAKENRIKAKKRRSEVKKLRNKPVDY